MRFGLSEKTIEQINNVFAKYSMVARAILYGSRARGNYKIGSDVDLTLVGDGLTQKILLQIMIELDDLLLPYKIDLSIYSQIDNLNLIEHVNRVGIVFYKKH